jgi:hypothetical protein
LVKNQSIISIFLDKHGDLEIQTEGLILKFLKKYEIAISKVEQTNQTDQDIFEEKDSFFKLLSEIYAKVRLFAYNCALR